MRIGIDATPVFRQRGGIGWYTYHLTLSLARIDHENTYVLYRDSSSQVFDDLGIAQRNFSVVDVAKWSMGRQAEHDAIDIFHGTNYKLPAHGKHGSVITVHDLALDRFPEYSRKFFGQRWASWRSRRVFSQADRIIAVSHHTAQDLHDYYGVSPERINVVYPGNSLAVNAAQMTITLTSLKQRYGLRGDAYILHVGGGEPRKNISALLEAYAMLGAPRRHYQLILIGRMGRWKEQIIRRVRQLGLTDDVAIMGYVAQEHLDIFYTHASLFVYPSLYEGFGIPPLEAMARGIPVITSNTTSLPEVVGDAAVMTDPLLPAALAQAITAVLTDAKLRERLRQKGLSRAKQFSWEQAARNTLAVYASVFREAYDRPSVH